MPTAYAARVPARERGRNAAHPSFINQTNLDHVLDVDTVLESVRGQLHPNQGFEVEHTIRWRLRRFVDSRRRRGISSSNRLAGIENVDGVAGFRAGAVQEHVDSLNVPIHEACSRERSLGSVQIFTAKKLLAGLSFGSL